jgi:hypothetical protein
LLWWLQHIAVAAVVLAVVWFAAPALARLARGLAGLLGRAAPRLTLGPTWARILLVVSGVALLCVSESGVGQLLTPRIVVLFPYIPLVALALLCVIVGIATKASAVVDDVPRGGSSR